MDFSPYTTTEDAPGNAAWYQGVPTQAGAAFRKEAGRAASELYAGTHPGPEDPWPIHLAKGAYHALQAPFAAGATGFSELGRKAVGPAFPSPEQTETAFSAVRGAPLEGFKGLYNRNIARDTQEAIARGRQMFRDKHAADIAGEERAIAHAGDRSRVTLDDTYSMRSELDFEKDRVDYERALRETPQKDWWPSFGSPEDIVEHWYYMGNGENPSAKAMYPKWWSVVQGFEKQERIDRGARGGDMFGPGTLIRTFPTREEAAKLGNPVHIDNGWAVEDPKGWGYLTMTDEEYNRIHGFSNRTTFEDEMQGAVPRSEREDLARRLETQRPPDKRFRPGRIEKELAEIPAQRQPDVPIEEYNRAIDELADPFSAVTPEEWSGMSDSEQADFMGREYEPTPEERDAMETLDKVHRQRDLAAELPNVTRFRTREQALWEKAITDLENSQGEFNPELTNARDALWQFEDQMVQKYGEANDAERLTDILNPEEIDEYRRLQFAYNRLLADEGAPAPTPYESAVHSQERQQNGGNLRFDPFATSQKYDVLLKFEEMLAQKYGGSWDPDKLTPTELNTWHGLQSAFARAQTPGEKPSLYIPHEVKADPSNYMMPHRFNPKLQSERFRLNQEFPSFGGEPPEIKGPPGMREDEVGKWIDTIRANPMKNGYFDIPGGKIYLKEIQLPAMDFIPEYQAMRRRVMSGRGTTQDLMKLRQFHEGAPQYFKALSIGNMTSEGGQGMFFLRALENEARRRGYHAFVAGEVMNEKLMRVLPHLGYQILDAGEHGGYPSFYKLLQPLRQPMKRNVITRGRSGRPALTDPMRTDLTTPRRLPPGLAEFQKQPQIYDAMVERVNHPPPPAQVLPRQSLGNKSMQRYMQKGELVDISRFPRDQRTGMYDITSGVDMDRLRRDEGALIGLDFANVMTEEWVQAIYWRQIDNRVLATTGGVFQPTSEWRLIWLR